MGQYIRADKRKGKTYYWLVESHRENGKVVQKRLRYLGTEKPDLATAKWGNAFGSKGVVRTKKETAKKTTTEKKPVKPEVVSTTEVDDGMSWLLG
jgi:hypothetical protein